LTDFKNEKFPSISLIDINHFLTIRTSFYSQDEIKAYKSLEAYNTFISGWVRHVKFAVIGGNTLIKGKVSYFFAVSMIHQHHVLWLQPFNNAVRNSETKNYNKSVLFCCEGCTFHAGQ